MKPRMSVSVVDMPVVFKPWMNANRMPKPITPMMMLITPSIIGVVSLTLADRQTKEV